MKQLKYSSKAVDIHFAVIYDENGFPIAVLNNRGDEVKMEDITGGVDFGLINGITSTTIISKPGQSPCCVTHGGYRWCWC